MAAKRSVAFDPVDIGVGANIKRQRQMRGLSQTALGEALGVTFQQIQKYENGRNRVSASALQKIADVLGVSVSCLFHYLPAEETTRCESMSCTGESIIASGPTENRDLNAAFASIDSRKVRMRIVALVQAIAEELR